MKYWIIGFSPETYKIVKAKKTIGVRANVWKRFSEELGVGDAFVGYVSREVIFDSIGKITGDAEFKEDMIFHDEKFYPGRRTVEFEKIGIKKPAKELFDGIEPFNEIRTVPGNYLMCRGGFVEILKEDFDWLIKEIRK